MRRTHFQDLVGLELPIVQGPFGGGISTVDLVAGVSNRGGLGSFGAYLLSGDDIMALAQRIRAKTNKPFALNLWISNHDQGGQTISGEEFERHWRIFEPFYREYGLERPSPPVRFNQPVERQIEAVLEARPRVFSFVFGIPSADVLAECRRREIITVGAATTLAEGLALEQAGVDVILATGFEAGGHRPAFLARAEDNLIGTLPLTRSIAARVGKPVIAGGGLIDADGIRAALALGAGGAQLGTAFLACKESGTVDAHRDILFGPRSQQTVLTRAYSGRLARGIPNRLVREMEKHNLAPFPVPVWFLSKLKAAAMARGDEDFQLLYAGQGAPLLEHRSVDALMGALVEGLHRPI